MSSRPQTPLDLESGPSVRLCWAIYRARLRSQWRQEALALVGVILGVALFFAVQQGTNSLSSSYSQVTRALFGGDNLVISSRGPAGLSERLARRVRKTKGVAASAGVLTVRGALIGREERVPVTLVGATRDLPSTGARFSPLERATSETVAIAVSRHTASQLRVGAASPVSVEMAGRSFPGRIARVGALARNDQLDRVPLAAVRLEALQARTALKGRVSSVVVRPSPGRGSSVARSISAETHGTADISTPAASAASYRRSSEADQQSSSLFSALAWMAGLLFAFNAFLVTASNRRRAIHMLRVLGAKRTKLLLSVAFDGLVLGVVGTALGILLGYPVSRAFFSSTPEALAAAFPLGIETALDSRAVAAAALAGVVGTLAAAVLASAGLLSSKLVDGHSGGVSVPGRVGSARARKRAALIGAVLIAAAVVIAARRPQATLSALGVTELGLLLIAPALVVGALAVFRRTASRSLGLTANLAAAESVSAPLRATAIAATTGLAVFGAVTLLGARDGVSRGVNQLTSEFFANADIWVTPGRIENAFGTVPFPDSVPRAKLERLSSVLRVRPFRATFVAFGKDTVWLLGQPPKERSPLLPSQILSGSTRQATARLRQGNGWVAMTDSLARQHRLHVGEPFTFPTATGSRRFRLAATVSNMTWPSGTVIISEADFQRWWPSPTPTALHADVRQGISLQRGQAEVRRRLAGYPGLKVEIGSARRAEIAGATNRNLSRLTQISRLLVLVAVLAAIATVASGLAEQKQRLRGWRCLGLTRREALAAISLETGLPIAGAAFFGAVAGLFGQYLAIRYMVHAINLPAEFSPAWGTASLICVSVVAMATATAAMLTWRATRI